MREEGAVHLRQFRIWSAMVRVAMTTTELRIIMFHPAMHGGDVLHLCGNGRVAHSAAIFHPCRFPRRGMTGFAVPADLRMGCDPSKHLPTSSVQWARIVYQPTTGVGVPSNDKGSDQGRNDPGPGQTSQTIVVSHWPSQAIRLRVLSGFFHHSAPLNM